MNIGDERMETPTIYLKVGIEVSGPQKCVVTYINWDHGWYQVEFTSALGWKFRECFWLPEKGGKGTFDAREGARLPTYCRASGGALYGQWPKK